MVYAYFGETLALPRMVGKGELKGKVELMKSGGTLAVFLAYHALSRG